GPGLARQPAPPRLRIPAGRRRSRSGRPASAGPPSRPTAGQADARHRTQPWPILVPALDGPDISQAIQDLLKRLRLAPGCAPARHPPLPSRRSAASSDCPAAAARSGNQAGHNPGVPTAARAACPPVLAGLAPRTAGGLGNLAGRVPAADRARHRYYSAAQTRPDVGTCPACCPRRWRTDYTSWPRRVIGSWMVHRAYRGIGVLSIAPL